MVNSEIASRIWVGVVEQNVDPLKLGRVKARVPYLHGDLPLEVLPWIHPRKDANGNAFNVPRLKKVVNIEYHDGDITSGEYIAAEHYNINLQNVIESLDDAGYAEFVAVYLDHATQIYRSQDKGLVLDNEYSNINLDNDGNISHNLRDNKAKLNLGTANASQPALLGDHWLEWFDTLVDCLLQGGFIGNMGAPLIANPQLIQVMTKYKALRNPIFLSKHVFMVDNNQVTAQTRPYVKQSADGYAENTKENVPVVEETPYTPTPPTEAEVEEQQTAKTEAEAVGKDPAVAEEDEPIEFYQDDEMSATEIEADTPVSDGESDDDGNPVTEEEDDSGAATAVGGSSTGTSKPKAKKLNPDATKHIGDLTLAQLKRYIPGASKKRLEAFLDPLNQTMAKYNIDTALRKAHFLAQVAHESGNLEYMRELASGKAYEGRKDLGNTSPGDGVRFAGRGLIQLTGRSNYAAYSRYVKLDLLSDPAQIERDYYLAADVSGWFWITRRMTKYPKVKVLLKFSDEDNVVMVSKLVNGGKNGLADRQRRTASIKREMNIA